DGARDGRGSGGPYSSARIDVDVERDGRGRAAAQDGDDHTAIPVQWEERGNGRGVRPGGTLGHRAAADDIRADEELIACRAARAAGRRQRQLVLPIDDRDAIRTRAAARDRGPGRRRRRSGEYEIPTGERGVRGEHERADGRGPEARGAG